MTIFCRVNFPGLSGYFLICQIHIIIKDYNYLLLFIKVSSFNNKTVFYSSFQTLLPEIQFICRMFEMKHISTKKGFHTDYFKKF